MTCLHAVPSQLPLQLVREQDVLELADAVVAAAALPAEECVAHVAQGRKAVHDCGHQAEATQSCSHGFCAALGPLERPVQVMSCKTTTSIMAKLAARHHQGPEVVPTLTRGHVYNAGWSAALERALKASRKSVGPQVVDLPTYMALLGLSTRAIAESRAHACRSC